MPWKKAPLEARLYSNLGVALLEVGELAEAEEVLRAGLRLEPTLASGQNNLGILHLMLGRHAEAIRHFDLALRVDEGMSKAKRNRALAQLALGEWADAWHDFEWRREGVQAPSDDFARPKWRGESGVRVLLTAEQGLGDTMQWVRYAQRVKERVGKSGQVLLACPQMLWQVLRGVDGIDEMVRVGEEAGKFECHAALAELPGIFGTRVDTVPGGGAYLHAETARVEKWRAWLSDVRAFKVGVVWQGNPGHQWDRFRSMRLEMLAPLGQVQDVQLVSLQRGPGQEQMAACRAAGLNILDPATQMRGDEADAWADVAALMDVLDVVVTVDTGTAHLAGALGKQVWVALSVVADWALADRAQRHGVV